MGRRRKDLGDVKLPPRVSKTRTRYTTTNPRRGKL